MTDHNSSLVNLTIPQNVTQPIVAAKIQEAVLAAMGGADKIVEAVVKQIATQKVSRKDGRVSGYSSENEVTWIDYHVTTILQGAIQAELQKQVVELASPVRDALIKELQSKPGATKVAKLLLGALDGQNNVVLTFDIKEPKKKSPDW